MLSIFQVFACNLSVFLGKCPFRSAHLLIEWVFVCLFVCLILAYMCVLYILETNALITNDNYLCSTGNCPQCSVKI